MAMVTPATMIEETAVMVSNKKTLFFSSMIDLQQSVNPPPFLVN
jgi:hypothetical protein